MRVRDQTGEPVGYLYSGCEDGALISTLFGRRVLWIPFTLIERVSGGELYITRPSSVPNKVPMSGDVSGDAD
jgi:hypothetical protein